MYFVKISEGGIVATNPDKALEYLGEGMEVFSDEMLAKKAKKKDIEQSAKLMHSESASTTTEGGASDGN